VPVLHYVRSAGRDRDDGLGWGDDWRAGEFVQVLAAVVVEAQGACERVEHLVGWMPVAATFQAHVVVDADAGQVGELVSA